MGLAMTAPAATRVTGLIAGNPPSAIAPYLHRKQGTCPMSGSNQPFEITT
jgi:hypothetical protein